MVLKIFLKQDVVHLTIADTSDASACYLTPNKENVNLLDAAPNKILPENFHNKSWVVPCVKTHLYEMYQKKMCGLMGMALRTRSAVLGQTYILKTITLKPQARLCLFAAKNASPSFIRKIEKTSDHLAICTDFPEEWLLNLSKKEKNSYILIFLNDQNQHILKDYQHFRDIFLE